MGRIADLEKEWRSNISASKIGTETVKHVVTLSDLMAELMAVFELTGSSVVLEARREIGNSDLVDENGHWKKKQISWDHIPYPCPAQSVQRLISQGKSEREACAIVAVRNHISAASFEAAIAQVRRAWKKASAPPLTFAGEKKSKI